MYVCVWMLSGTLEIKTTNSFHVSQKTTYLSDVEWTAVYFVIVYDYDCARMFSSTNKIVKKN